MKKILFNYLLSNYLMTIFKVTLIAYSFGLILNLFEEIEFFKNINSSLFMPVALTALYIPSLIIKLLHFIILIASMWFLLKLRNTKDLLTLKVFGYSNLKIFLILATTSFILGWIILFALNPVTSAMMKYYEKTKSEYSRDIDHLVTINKNGLWIKENTTKGQRIITADETRDKILKNVTVFNLDNNYALIEKISSETADITDNQWSLNKVTISTFDKGLVTEESLENYTIQSKYDFKKITSLFRNFETMSFIELILDYKDLQNKGYNKTYLDQNLNSMLAMPFFLFLMTGLASILTMNTLKRSNNFTFIIAGLVACVVIYYFNNLSLALGQTNRISLSLAAWMPVLVVTLFSSIGILQINEK